MALPVVEASRVAASPHFRPFDAATVEGRFDTVLGDVGRIAVDCRALSLALGLAVAGWVAQAALWLSMYALGYAVSPAFPLFVVPLAAIGNVLPLPGGVGGVETAMIGLLAATTGIPIAVATGATFTDVAYLIRNTI